MPANAPHAPAAPQLKNGQRLKNIAVKLGRFRRGAIYVPLIPRRAGIPRLLALPNLTLEKLILLAQKHPELLISGRITVYSGAYYILLAHNIYLPARAGMKTAAPMGTINRKRASHQKPQAIMSKLLVHTIGTPASESVTVKPATKVTVPISVVGEPGPHLATAIPEGTYLWNRMGRIIFSPTRKQWIFIFDTDGRGAPDPPIVVLPSPILSQMQSLGAGQRTQPVLRISGVITQFDGQNFLVPTYVQLYHNLGRF